MNADQTNSQQEHNKKVVPSKKEKKVEELKI